MSEAMLQKRLTKHLRDQGWMVNPNIKPIGWPDLACFKNGKTIFIEVKLPTKPLRKLQKHIIDKFNQNGFNCYLIHSIQELKNLKL